MKDWISIRDQWPRDGEEIFARGLIPEMKAKFFLDPKQGYRIYLIFEDRCVETYGITSWRACF